MNLFSKFTSLFDRFRKNRIAALVSFPIEQPNKIVAEKVLPIGSPFFVGQKKLGEIVTAKSESCLMQTALRSGVIFTLKQDEILEEKGDLKANAIVKNYPMYLTLSEPLDAVNSQHTLLVEAPCEMIICCIRIPEKDMVVWELNFVLQRGDMYVPDCLRMKHTNISTAPKQSSPFTLSSLPRSVKLDFGPSGRCYIIKFHDTDAMEDFLELTSGRMVCDGLMDAEKKEKIEFGMRLIVARENGGSSKTM